MTNTKVALREYLEASQPVTLQELIDNAPAQEKRPITKPRLSPVWVTATAAVILIFLIGGVWLLTAGDQSPVITQPPLPSSTLPQATTSPTTVAPAVVTPPEVSGRWTLYSSAQGLPSGGITAVAVGSDGTAWAVQMGSAGSLSRLDGTEWSRVADAPEGDWHQWMTVTPDGGVAMAIASGESGENGRRAHRIVRFDGGQWLDDTGDILDISGLVTGIDEPRILGYDLNDRPVDIRFTDGAFGVKSVDRSLDGGTPSFASISNTVDVDSAGLAWFGTTEGAWRLDGNSLELFEFGIQGMCCAPLAVDANDNVWISIDAPEDQLFRLSPSGERTRFTREDGIPFLRQSDYVAFVPTAGGNVWVLGRGRGVASFNGATWTSYTVEEALIVGIPTMRSFQGLGIVNGSDGSTWTISHRGEETEPVMHRFFGDQWKRVPSPGVQRGLSHADYGTLGTAVGPDGSLWIPTSTGVARFQPTGD